jgi:hypothetical protein
MKVLPADGSAKVTRAREAYLAGIRDSEAKALGVKLGDEAAMKVIESRVNDGNDVPVYGWKFVTMRPFAMTGPSQFRPAPPIPLTSKECERL